MHLVETLERDMRQLWKETFHDSERYIDILFSTYFNPEFVCVRYDKGILVASLLAIPYRLAIDGRIINTLYLCGLATRPDYRRKGIMGQLMNEIESKALKLGYDCTFLIPADDHLRHYYYMKGYRDCSYVHHSPEVTTVVSDTSVSEISEMHQQEDNLTYTSIRQIPHDLKNDFISIMAQWCEESEHNAEGDRLLHDRKDYESIIRENENTIFATDASLCTEYPVLAKLSKSLKKVYFPGSKYGLASKLNNPSSESYSSSGLVPYGMMKKLTPIPTDTFSMGLLLD